jgi:hypothetical protein
VTRIAAVAAIGLVKLSHLLEVALDRRRHLLLD